MYKHNQLKLQTLFILIKMKVTLELVTKASCLATQQMNGTLSLFIPTLTGLQTSYVKSLQLSDIRVKFHGYAPTANPRLSLSTKKKQVEN